MNDAELFSAVSSEIIELHIGFERWFCGDGPEHLDRVEAVLAPEFSMVAPNGIPVQRSEVMANLENARGLHQIRIEIASQNLVWHSADAVLAGYDEIQHHASFTTRRRSTGLFSREDTAPNGLVWRHVHETWIEPPPD